MDEFIPALWLEPGLFGDKLVAFGILEDNWKEVFGVAPTLAFKPDKPVPATCENERTGLASQSSPD